MKKALLTFPVILLSLSLALPDAVPAQEKTVPSRESAKDGAGMKSMAPSGKARVDFYTGTIESLDTRKGDVIVKRRQTSKSFKAGDEKVRKQLEEYNPGDKVMIKHVDGSILSIIKPGKNKPAPSAPATGK